jgi:hypothetical protein
MTKDQKCRAIVERLFELSEKGMEVTFSEHMDETVIEWSVDRVPVSHAHVAYYKGEKGKIDSLLRIIVGIELEDEGKE